MLKKLYNIPLKSTVCLLICLIGSMSLLKAHTYVVTNARPDGNGSLKQAIDKANQHVGLDKIIFNLPKNQKSYVIQLGNKELRVSDPLIIDGFGDKTLLKNNNTLQPVNIFLTASKPNAYGSRGIFSLKNTTFKGIGLEKNNLLKIQKGAQFYFENCVFINEIAPDKSYNGEIYQIASDNFQGVLVNENANLKNCLIEDEPMNHPKLQGNTLKNFIRHFSKYMKVSGFDFNNFVQNNVDLSQVNKSISDCNILKLYTDTVANQFDKRVLYRLTPKSDTVPPSSNVLNIIISEHAIIVAQPNDISECIGGNLQMAIAISGGTGNITYQWQISVDGISFTDVEGAKANTFTPPSTTVGNTYYRVVISSDVDGCGPITSTAATVSILADPSVSINAEKDILCEGETATLTASVTGGLNSTTTIQWQSSTDGTIWADINGATEVKLVTSPLTVSTKFRAVVRQGNGCETISSPLTIQMGSCNGVIGDFVWLDCNKNGIQDADEKGIGGVAVTLRGTAIGGDPVIQTVTTNPNGNYRFSGIKPGTYTLVFSYPSTMTGLSAAKKDQNNDVVDSDINPDGKTDEFIFSSNQITTDLDAGFVDIGAPTITAASDLTVSCDGAGNETELKNWLDNQAGATAVDNMSEDIVWTNDYTTVIKNCGSSGEVKVTFTATDECGNSATTSAFFKIKDEQAPVFSNIPSDLKLRCGDAVPLATPPSVSDVCGSSPVLEFQETREDLCGSSYKIVRTWTAKDDCGNVSTITQAISFEDNEPPRLINIPTTLNLTCNDLIPPGTGVVAVDNCDGTPRVTMSDLIERGICGSNYKINRLWTAVDVCGNVAKATQIITVGDFDAPQITGVPADISVTCGSQIGSPSKNVKANDNCSVSVRLSVNDKISYGACSDNYTVSRTWTATDVCGNVTTKTQKIVVKDDINPELIGVPVDVTVQLNYGHKVPPKANVIATDNCDSYVDLTYVETRINNLCGYTLKRTWTAVDNCQNRLEKTQTITVMNADNTAKLVTAGIENCNDKNGRAELSPSTGNYTYAWSDGKTGYLRTDLAAGSYKVTATSSTNCSVVIDVNIKRECDCDKPIVSVNKQDYTCNIDKGSAQINVTNALPADLKFIWSPNVSNSNVATNLPAGNYTVRVERFNKPTCFSDITFSIKPNEYVTIEEPTLSPASCNALTGRIEFKVPANDTLIFKWSDGNNTEPVRTGLASGQYTVTISRPNSLTCPLIKTVEVTNDILLKATHVINRQPTCGLPNGAVTINTTGGSGNYTYSWGEGNSRFVLPAGPVNVTVTDIQTGCFTVVSFALKDQSPQATTIMDTVFRVSCPGMADGRAVFNVRYGSDFAEPAKYEIRDINNNLYANGALSVGSAYILMVKDSSGCMASSVKFKVVDPPVIVPSLTKSNESCETLGHINIMVTGGAGGYKFTWADLGNQVDQTPYRDKLKAGFYSVTIVDAAGCQKVMRNIQIKDSCACRPAVIDSIKTINANCTASDGSATLILRGGNESNYTYAWSTNLGTANTVGNSRNGLPTGIYTVTITSKTTLTCVSTVKVAIGTVEGPTGVSSQMAPASCDAADGSITLTANEPMNYVWAFDGKTVSTRNDLKAGVYQIMVARSNAPNCATALLVKVTSQSKLTAFATIGQKATCGSANGIATIRVSGGSGNYKYSWGVDSLKKDLKAGVYVVTVTDLVTNCVLPVTFSMSDDNVAAATINISNPTVYLNCANNNNGRVKYTISYADGFAFPSAVYITDGNGRMMGNDSLPKGSYCIVVKDNTGCIAGSQCFEVVEPTPITATYAASNKTCNDGGRIILTAINGGSGNYQYAWSDKPALSTVFDRSSLQVGTYSVTIYDAKGCTYVVDTIKIKTDCPNENYCTTLKAATTTTNASCTEGGKIQLAISGGTAPFSHDWADLASTNNAPNRTSLEAGTYSITVTDAAGCKTQLDNIVISNTCNFPTTCTPPVVSDIIVTDASCSRSTGEIIINVLRPANVVYKWLPNVSSTNTAKNLLAGVYKIKISTVDDTSCFIEREIVVKNQDGTTLNTPNITPATCGANNGKVVFAATGKVLNYAWSDGLTGSVRADLAKGNYTVTVSDPSGVGCPQYSNVVVPAVNGLLAVAVIDNRSVCGQATGQATIKPIGGSGSYTYSWGSSATKTNLKAGIYNVTVTDNQTGCTAMVSVNMTDETAAFATVNVAQPLIYLACAGENNASVVYDITYSSGFALPANVVITDNLGRVGKNDQLSAGRYSIFVYDKNNCLAGLGNFEIREPQIILLNTSVASQKCGSKGSIVVNVSGGSGVYTFIWGDLSGSNQTNKRNELFTGEYYLTVSDSRGCSKVTKITVQNEALDCRNNCDLKVTPTTFVKSCNEEGKINLIILNGSGNYNFLWSDLGNATNQSQNRIGLNSGLYSVTITDLTTNCRVILSNLEIENKAINCPPVKCILVANVDVNNATCTEGGAMRAVVISGNKPFKFDWLDLPGTDNPQNRFNLLSGIYTLIISDSLGCKDTLSNIEVKDSCLSTCTPPSIANMNVTDASCFSNNGSISIAMSGITNNYVYKWLPAVSTSNNATGLPAGLYKVRIARAEDTLCFVEKNILVNSKNENIVLTAPIVTDASCGTSNGAITINGQSGWVYKWNDGATGNTRTTLAPNTYYVSVTDPSVSGCPVVKEVVVKEMGSLQVSTSIDRKPTCGASNGQVTIIVNGGSGNYNYSWGTTVRSNLKAGNYSVLVYDNQTGCSSVVSVDLIDDVQAVATVSITTTRFSLNCKGDENGKIDYTVAYGIGFAQPAVVNITNESGVAVENGKLKAGKYKITVTDANGCVASVTPFELTDPNSVVVQTITKASECNTLGAITLNVSGGTGSFTYDWADVAGTVNSRDRNDLSSNLYNVVIKDGNGCVTNLKNIQVANNCASATPRRDTVYKKIVVGKTDSVCVPTDAAFIGQSLSYSFCNGGNEISSNSGTSNLRASGCVTFTANMSTGRDELCVRTCNINGICDTTIFQFDVIADPSACQTSYVGASKVSVASCDEEAVICTFIPYSQMENYTVTDNNQPIQFYTTGCKQDTQFTYNYYALTKFYPNGPWDLSSWTVDDISYKARIQTLQGLVDSMNVWDPRGNWVLNVANQTIVGGDNSKVYGSMAWKRSGRNISTLQVNKQTLPLFLSLKLKVGTHNLVFTDNAKACKDSALIKVECNVPPIVVGSYTIETIVYTDQKDTICFNNSAWAYQSTITNVCSANYKGHVGYAIDDNTDCIRLIGTGIGRDTLCLRRCYTDGRCDTIKLHILVKPFVTASDTACIKPYSGINYFNVPCGTKARFCTNLQSTDTINYEITLNGIRFNNGYFGCTADTSYAYNYYTLVLSNPRGPWKLESWIVNGNTFSGVIPSIVALVDSMNVWDREGKWRYEPNNFSIVGGKSGSNYGNMIWYNINTNTKIATLGPNRQINILQIGMLLDTGYQRIVFRNILRGCSDTITVQVECRELRTRPSTIIKDTTVYVNETSKYCLPTSGILTTDTRIATICNVKGYISYVVDDKTDCISITGNSVGKDTICLQRCDSDGECDTIKLAVNVLKRAGLKTETVFYSAKRGSDSTYCVKTNELTGTRFTLRNVCESNSTYNVNFIINGLCVTYMADNKGVDTACLVVSDELGNFDTTRLIIYVVEEKEALPAPIAFRDRATTAKATEVVIKPMDNDSLFGLPSNIIVLSQPKNGQLSYDPTTNNVVYSPNNSSDCVNRDSFHYAVINAGGKDTAEVVVEVLCDEIVVFSGFSPNGDGSNDYFVILGLEKYPNHKLFVFNQRGNQVFMAENYQNTWNGVSNGIAVPDGTYFWILDLGNGKKQSGYVQIHR